jgi:hypothetical protein
MVREVFRLPQRAMGPSYSRDVQFAATYGKKLAVANRGPAWHAVGARPSRAKELRNMCRRVQCETCGKPTYAGCGMHIEQVLGDVPVAERCRCRETKGEAGAGDKSPSMLRRILGN